MKSIFLIVKDTEGPSGHGGGGADNISLLHDGCYGIGTPAPAFDTAELAESFRKEHDEYNYYRVIGMDVMEANSD